MFHEKDLEDIISKYPEIIEDGLTLKERQLTFYGRRMDLLFEDKLKRRLILELKNGPIKDQHIGQIMCYEGMLLSADDPTIRIMLVGTRVPPNIQRSLDHHGIAWKEITYSYLKKFLSDKEDELFLNLFSDEEYTSAQELHLQQKYWEGLKNFMETRGSFVKIRKPYPKSWSDISLGKSDIYLTAGINSKSNSLIIWLVIRGSERNNHFDNLYKLAYNDSLIEINGNIKWDRMPDRQRCGVVLNQTADYLNKNEWESQFEWFKENLEKYVKFFKPLIMNI